MYLIAIAWMYVALMMALAEATHPQGSVLGAIFTFLIYGAAPLALVMYLVGTPMRRKAQARQAAEDASTASDVSPTESTAESSSQPDQGGHAAGPAITPKRKEA